MYLLYFIFILFILSTDEFRLRLDVQCKTFFLRAPPNFPSNAAGFAKKKLHFVHEMQRNARNAKNC